jgi:uncharacterized protein (DUF924 family)
MGEELPMEKIRDELLDFWFGDATDDVEAGQAQAALWWGASAETDDLIAGRFGQAASAAAAGTLDHWTGSPRGRLALILLLDQMPRVIHRGTPGAFAQDDTAQRIAAKGLDSGAHRLLRPIERVFFYLPFEHSEDGQAQERSIELYRALAEEVPENWRKSFDFYLDFAVRHKAIIDRFGRFPHRNAILGRESTPEEIEFLKEPGSGF